MAKTSAERDGDVDESSEKVVGGMYTSKRVDNSKNKRRSESQPLPPKQNRSVSVKRFRSISRSRSTSAPKRKSSVSGKRSISGDRKRSSSIRKSASVSSSPGRDISGERSREW